MGQDEKDHSPGHSNAMSGHSTNSVQAGSVAGGIHFHTSEPTPAAPHHLPSRPANFTGREADLAKLDALLSADLSGSRSTVIVSAVAGTAGVGKTALALHWIHSILDRFPDGDLYVNLQGYGPGPLVSPEQALEGFLLALGVHPGGIPQGAEARGGLFRSLLRDRRMVILLDNARNAEQVRPLLPATGTCLVLVTSRSQLSGLVVRDGARRIALDMLSPEESFELLRSIIGIERVAAEPDAAALLAVRCAHLPLALRVTAEVAAARPHHSLAELAAELSPGSGRLNSLATYDEDDTAAVREVFSWSYRNLPVSTARIFRLLSLSPGPDISLKAAAALLQMPLSLTLRNLLILVGANLLEMPSSDRFHFHDLLRDYALERTLAEDGEEVREDAVNRLLNWYLFNSEEAGKVLNLRRGPAPFSITGGDRPSKDLHISFASRAGSIDWCESEFSNLLAAIQQAKEIGNNAVAWQLPIALRSFFQLRRPTADWIASNLIALRAARTLGDDSAEITVLRAVSGSYCYMGLYDEYFEYCAQAVSMARRSGYLEGWCLNNMGDALYYLNRFQESADSLESALEIGRRDADQWLVAHTLENLAPTYHALGRSDEAVAALDESLAIFIDLRYPFGQGLVMDKLANIQHSLGSFDESISSGFRALDLHCAAGNKLGEITALEILARATESTGRTDESRGHRVRALAIMEELGLPDAERMRSELAHRRDSEAQEKAGE